MVRKVSPEDIKEVLSRSKIEGVKEIIRHVAKDYDQSELQAILDGEGWLDATAVAVCAMRMVSVFLLAQGIASDTLISLLERSLMRVLAIAFVLGYEKRESEALAKELGELEP